MFERYTEKARRTIFLARQEASNFGSPYIETEHLLLGLLNDGFVASFVLEGISVQGIREHILATLPRHKEIPTSVDLPLTRHDIQVFLNAQAKNYSRSSIHGMQTVLQIILGYAFEEKLIPTYPCIKIKCPVVTNTKRCVRRGELNEQQKLAIVARMKEPYAHADPTAYPHPRASRGRGGH
jgi:ATP-dependent Clp protease ATP-binding subunit ClpA